MNPHVPVVEHIDVEGTTIEHVKYGALSLAYWY